MRVIEVCLVAIAILYVVSLILCIWCNEGFYEVEVDGNRYETKSRPKIKGNVVYFIQDESYKQISFDKECTWRYVDKWVWNKTDNAEDVEK